MNAGGRERRIELQCNFPKYISLGKVKCSMTSGSPKLQFIVHLNKVKIIQVLEGYEIL